MLAEKCNKGSSFCYDSALDPLRQRVAYRRLVVTQAQNRKPDLNPMWILESNHRTAQNSPSLFWVKKPKIELDGTAHVT